MTFWKRLLAGLVFLLSAATLLVCLAGAVGVWVAREPALAKTTRVFSRVEAGLDLADRGLEQVKSSLARAEDHLKAAREEQRKLAQAPRRDDPLRRMAARTAVQKVAPEMTNAREHLNTVAEAAVVVSSVLQDAEASPFFPASGVDAEQLTDLSNRLAQLGPTAWGLSRDLDRPGTEHDPAAAEAQLSRVEQFLAAVRQLTADFERRLTDVRQRTAEVRSRTLTWIPRGVLILSATCFWIALSQVSLMVHASSWWKRAGRAPG